MTGRVCYRCRRETSDPVAFLVSVHEPGQLATDAKWTQSGSLCRPCSLDLKRAAFGVLDVAPAGGVA